MNSLTNRDYEIYNFNGTSEYGGGLINNKINDYFNDILNVPEVKPVTIISKPEQTWGKFYRDYLEPNILFFVLLIGVAIFLVIRYYTLDMDPDKEPFDKDINDLDEFIEDDDEDVDLDDPESYIKYKKKKMKYKYKNKIKKYKEELANEKQKILDLIDELSSINYEENNHYNQMSRDLENKISLFNEQKRLDQIENSRQLEELKRLGLMVQAKNNDAFSNQIVKFNLPDSSNYSNSVNTSGDNYSNNYNSKTNQKTKPGTGKNSKTKTFSERDRQYGKYEKSNPLDHTIKNFDTDSDDNSNYYRINKHNTNNDDFFDGIYINPPYN